MVRLSHLPAGPGAAGGTPGVELVNLGLGLASERRTLFVPQYRGFVYDGLATFSETAARAYLSAETLYGFDARLLSIQSHVCQTEPLDSFGMAPSFIKIDVEGCEHEVLEGGIDTLRRHEPVLMIERFYENEAVLRILAALGYQEVVERGGRFAPGEAAGLNMFWMTPRRLEQARG